MLSFGSIHWQNTTSYNVLINYQVVFACNTGGSCCSIVVAAVQGDKALKCVLPLEKAASSLSLGSGMAQVCLSELCVQAVDITTANPQLSFSLT